MSYTLTHLYYLLILISIFIPVLIISILRPIRKLRNFRALLLSTITVAIPYVIWDMLAVHYGLWYFNGRYVIGIFIYGIPVEEIVFFLVVPFATLLIYDGLRILDVRIKHYRIPGISLSVVLLAVALLYRTQLYTFSASLAASAALFFGSMKKDSGFEKLSFWIYIMISYIPFFFFDGIMTSLPVFTYGKGMIWGVRITTIPIEEFIYVFSLLVFYGCSYTIYGDMLLSRKSFHARGFENSS